MFKVRAWIDGTSRLVVSPGSLVWDHRAFLQPGRGGGGNLPTYLDGYPWFPQWPGADDQLVTCDPLFVTSRFETNNIALNLIQGRGLVQIIQQPGPTNGETFIVEFDDGPQPGADWYEVELVGMSVEYNAPLSIGVASVALSWFAKTNRIYQVQFATNLQAPSWTNLGSPIPGAGTNVSVTDNVVGNPKRFYRVIIVP